MLKGAEPPYTTSTAAPTLDPLNQAESGGPATAPVNASSEKEPSIVPSVKHRLVGVVCAFNKQLELPVARRNDSSQVVSTIQTVAALMKPSAGAEAEVAPVNSPDATSPDAAAMAAEAVVSAEALLDMHGPNAYAAHTDAQGATKFSAEQASPLKEAATASSSRPGSPQILQVQHGRSPGAAQESPDQPPDDNPKHIQKPSEASKASSPRVSQAPSIPKTTPASGSKPPGSPGLQAAPMQPPGTPTKRPPSSRSTNATNSRPDSGSKVSKQKVSALLHCTTTPSRFAVAYMGAQSSMRQVALRRHAILVTDAIHITACMYKTPSRGLLSCVLHMHV